MRTTRRLRPAAALTALALGTLALSAPHTRSAARLPAAAAATAPDTSVVGGPITPDEMAGRAQFWVDNHVPYHRRATYPDPQGRAYRTDCSGYVSMAWHLPESALTSTLTGYAVQLPGLDSLRRGDAVDNTGNTGSWAEEHAVLFDRWADAAHTRALVYSEGRPGTAAAHETYTRGYLTANGYVAYRYKNVAASAPDPADVPVVGDWDGNGAQSAGLYRPGLATFYLRDSNTAGPADEAIALGEAGDEPVVGDWNGDGRTDVGVYRPSDRGFRLRNADGTDRPVIYFGAVGDVPIAGDWDGDGTTDIGVYRPGTAHFYLRHPDGTVTDFAFGNAGDLPVTGRWDASGVGVGVYRPANGHFYLRDPDGTPHADSVFGTPGQDLPVAGDWRGGTDAVDGIGVYRPDEARFYLSNSNSAPRTDYSFTYGDGGRGGRPAGRPRSL